LEGEVDVAEPPPSSSSSDVEGRWTEGIWFVGSSVEGIRREWGGGEEEVLALKK